MQHYTFCDQKVHAHFGKTVLYPISHFHFFSFNTLSSSEIYHITILKDLLIKYRPFKCNIDHKFKNIDQLSQMVDYRPMVGNMDPLAALLIEGKYLLTTTRCFQTLPCVSQIVLVVDDQSVQNLFYTAMCEEAAAVNLQQVWWQRAHSGSGPCCRTQHIMRCSAAAP